MLRGLEIKTADQKNTGNKHGRIIENPRTASISVKYKELFRTYDRIFVRITEDLI